MKQSSSTTGWAVLGLSAVLLLGGVALAVTEAAPFFRPSQDDDSRWQSIVADLSGGISTTSRNVLLDDCFWAADSFYGRIANGDERAGVLARCAAFIRDHVAQFPTDSYGFTALAYVAAALGNPRETDEALMHAQATGPYEEWVAEIRVPLAELHLDWLSAQTAAGHQADLALLVQTNRGIRSIAQRYVVEPGFRERITDIVETLPSEVQKRFLGTVRSAAAATRETQS